MVSLIDVKRRTLVGSLALLVAFAGLAASGREARAIIVERVVAVVGERPVWLSELRHRARPNLARIAATVPNAAQQAAAETEMFRTLLNRIVDDRLEEVAADKARLVVTTDEVDNAIKNIADNAHLPVKELVEEAKKAGLSEQDYRDEIRRQLLEGKLLRLRVAGRVRVTDQDARGAYSRWLREIGDEAQIDARLLAIRLDPGQDVAERKAYIEKIAERGRNGEDFCKLVAEYSEDFQTKTTCGSRGPQALSALKGPLQTALEGLKPGDISEPVVVPNEAVLIVQLQGTAKIPGFDEVRDTMMERAYGEAMERQRKLWLSELRRGVYIDVRF